MDDRRRTRGIGKIATAAAPPVPIRVGSEPTDHQLVAAVRTGDDRAFECLYQRYHRRIASYIYGMVNDFGRAEDIAQDVFVSALRRMRETDRPIAFKPWIYEIAKNACIDQFRRSRRAEEVSYDSEEGLGAADYGRLVTTGPTPDVAVDQKMSLDHLRGAFGGLSETHHEILVMREFEGLSYREIGQRLGMSRPSVESTLFRARRRLSEEYEELISGERCVRIQAIITDAADGSLGMRDKRRMARHISYCQPCRRHARGAGLDTAALTAKPARAKIAAIIPLPAFLRRRWDSGDAGRDGTVANAASSHVSTLAQWSASIGQAVDPAWVGWAKAATAAAAIAVAGVGADIATRDGLGQRSSPSSFLGTDHGSSSSTAALRTGDVRRVGSGVKSPAGPVGSDPKADAAKPAAKPAAPESGPALPDPTSALPPDLLPPAPSDPTGSDPGDTPAGGFDPQSLIPQTPQPPSAPQSPALPDPAATADGAATTLQDTIDKIRPG